MTKRVGPFLIIQEEPPQQCDLCGKIDELRPYGPNSEKVCFDCGMKDKEAAERGFLKMAGLV